MSIHNAKEMLVDFRLDGMEPQPVHVKGSDVATVDKCIMLVGYCHKQQTERVCFSLYYFHIRDTDLGFRMPNEFV